MKKLTLIATLVFNFHTPTWGQGSIGQYSESQILELIKEARMWTNPEAQQYFNEEEKSLAREFLSEHQPVLNSLGKKAALYYFKMLEINNAGKFGHSADLAYAARAHFWWHRDEYTAEEKSQLEHAKEFLAPTPEQRQMIDDEARRSADVAIRQNVKQGFYLSWENTLAEDRPTHPRSAFLSEDKHIAVPVQSEASASPASKYPVLLLTAAILAVGATAISFFLLRRRSKLPKA